MNQKLLIFIFIFIIFLFSNQNVFAYGTETHAALTQEIFDFYNQHFPENKISEALKDYLIDGARREDDIPRFFNHFYDPVYDRGLNDSVWGRGYASKIWAKDSGKQNQITYKVASTIASILSAFQQKKLNLVSTESDFTWQKAIDYYVNGEPEKAMFALGHILHLIEDASVPAHTRNDGHPAVLGDEDPYEVWAYQFNQKNIRQSIDKFLKNKKPIILNDLDAYFNSMATYSNNNFYSADTIGIQSGYDKPQPDYIAKDGDYFYGFKIDREFGDYRIFLKEKQSLFNTIISTTDNISLFVNKENGDKVLKDYWPRLATKAIEHGAGVINLFFQEVEKAKNNLPTAQKQESFLGQLVSSANSLISKIFETSNQPNSVIKLDEREVSNFENQLIDLNQKSQEKIKKCDFNTNQISTSKSLIINEVAWMGNVDNANAEWIELKNISNKALDVSDYQLMDSGGQIFVSLPKNTIIPAGGFYLLERSSDEAVPMVKADLIYQGALSNNNEALKLFNKDCFLLDEVSANPNWPAGDNNSKKTMERSLNLGWQTSVNPGGTPKAENSKPEKTELLVKPTEELFSTSSNVVTTSSKIQQVENLQTQTNVCLYETSKTPLFQKLIINEVAWMGSLNNSNAEWIELKNISGSSLDISGYWLLDKGGQIKIRFDNNSLIPAGGFYLLERNNDETVSGIKADKIYSGALSNTDEGLRLFDSQCNLLDEVSANPNWPAGDNNSKKTMERRADLSWQTSFFVGGTPKAANSSGISYSSSGGGGTVINNSNNLSSASPAKILINEVQITGGAGKTDNDFIELYNPNDSPVNLKGYRLVKRTKTGTSDLLIKSWTDDAYIPAKGFYLWANSNYLEIPSQPDVTTTVTLSNDNGVAIRFGANDTGTIIDSVSWGEAQNIFVEKSAFITNPGADQSIQRKFQNNVFVDTDNNAEDFEIQNCPSPKAQLRNCSAVNQAPSAFFVYSPQNPQVGEQIIFDASSSTDLDGEIVSYFWDFGNNTSFSATTTTVNFIYSQAGNYQVKLTVFDNQNASSTFTLNISVENLNANANHIVISEIQIEGDTAADEFIELYNPTDNIISLNGYSIQYLSGSASSTINIQKKNFPKEAYIAPKSFFLLVNNGASSSLVAKADMTYSFSLSGAQKGATVFLVSTTTPLLNVNDLNIVDSISYGNPQLTAGFVVSEMPAFNKSLERKAFYNNQCLPAQNEGEFLGNGCDTNTAFDFVIRDIPNPQNSKNLAEPRLAPQISNFKGEFNATSSEIILQWDQILDSSGVSSTIIYELKNESNLLMRGSSTFSFIFPVDTLGKNYIFNLQAFDKDGLASEMVSIEVIAPQPAMPPIAIFDNSTVWRADCGFMPCNYGYTYIIPPEITTFETSRSFNLGKVRISSARDLSANNRNFCCNLRARIIDPLTGLVITSSTNSIYIQDLKSFLPFDFIFAGSTIPSVFSLQFYTEEGLQALTEVIFRDIAIYELEP